MNIALFAIIAMGVLGVALVLAFLIRELAKVRLEEVRQMKKGTLTEEELDHIAEKLAARLARPSEDRHLLLDLAKMSEDEFRTYRDALREEERAAGRHPPERGRELG